MFNSKKKSEATGIINTIIGENSKIEGVLSASDSTRIDGLLRGEILSESSVIVGEHGVVKGDINAVEILVAGTVYGNLRAVRRIDLTETGRVLGDLFTKTLVIDEGASFKGNCSMEVAVEKEDLDKFNTATLAPDKGQPIEGKAAGEAAATKQAPPADRQEAAKSGPEASGAKRGASEAKPSPAEKNKKS